MSFVTGAIGFILGLGLLIVFHELGHYSVARLVGVKILRFSVGFGKPLARWVLGPDRTEYTLCAIPFGGYVAMMGQSPSDVDPREKGRAFCHQPLWARSAIVIAGPAANFLLAILLFATINVSGFYEIKPVVGFVDNPSIAMQAGLQADDEILRVDDAATSSWKKAGLAIAQGIIEKSSAKIEVLRDGQIAQATLLSDSPELFDGKASILEKIGIVPKIRYMPAVIAEVMSGESADRSGLKAGDHILSFDQKIVRDWHSLVLMILEHPGQSIDIEIERGGVLSTLPLQIGSTLKAGKSIGRVGIRPRIPEDTREKTMNFVRYSLPEAIYIGAQETLNMSVLTVTFLGKMITGNLSWKNINGPITIAEVTGSTFNLGWIAYLTTLALISISIGILNILPIPLLDGGHLFYYLIEFIKRSPVSEKVQEVGARVGIGLIGSLMLLALYNDFVRLLVP